jgi:hypothetical protein
MNRLCVGIQFKTERNEYYRCALDGQLTTQILGLKCPLCGREIDATDEHERPVDVRVTTHVVLRSYGSPLVVSVPEDHHYQAEERGETSNG